MIERVPWNSSLSCMVGSGEERADGVGVGGFVVWVGDGDGIVLGGWNLMGMG